ATVSLPGRGPAPAHYDLDLAVESGGELEWLPEPVVAARGSDLRMTTRVRLAAGARLLLRDEQVLGRVGEEPGRLAARLTVHHDGRLLLDQQTDVGPGAPGWDGPAVLGPHRALGQLLAVGTGGGADHAGPLDAEPAEAALLPLTGAGSLV